MMGIGKSSVGKVLASKMSLHFEDIDSLIAEKAGKSINKIFADDGEQAFRLLESTVIERVSHSVPSVVATGGGAVISESNRRMMRSAGVVVNLTAPLDTLLERLSGSAERPLYSDIDPESRIKMLLEERERFYADADIRIDTGSKTVEDVAAEILRFLEELRR